jgi:uncharacterized membrane protein
VRDHGSMPSDGLARTPAGYPEHPRAGAIPHACVPASGAGPVASPSTPPGRTVRERGPRLLGIDAARAIALLGMIAVHVMSPDTPSGGGELVWSLSAGRSAALFAVLAGVGIAFSTGDTRPFDERRRRAAREALAVRALLIGAIGLLLGSFVPFDTAGVILPYYALLFLFAIPLLGLSVRALAVLSGLTAVAVPVLSHVVRGSLTVPSLLENPTFTDLLTRPGPLLAELTLTGMYPALAWIAYVAAGLAIGRSPLSSRRFVIGLTAAGIGLAVLSRTVSRLLLVPGGGLDRLEDVATQTMSAEEFADVLISGASGTLPTTSFWWLAVRAPHTTTPIELLHTIGTSMAVIGAAIMLGWVLRSAIRPLADGGSMPLTLYTLHLLLLVSPLTPDDGGPASFALHGVVLFTFAVAWRRRLSRGPLEHVVWQVTGRVRDRRLRRREPA